ncbi:MAG TPA: hypothetical protein VH575_18850 [Gemmataceae bacterium]
MDRLTIKCASCGREWLAAAPFSLYEQQAVESCPCPHCGAYTLCCREPSEPALAPHWQALAKVRTLHAH